MSKVLRVGIVGCGGVAKSHLRGYRSMKDVQVVAVFDVAAASAQAMAQETGARVAASSAEMAARDALDAVSICTPPACHWQSARPFLAAHVPVYCEKPLERDATTAARFATAVQKSGTLFMMGFNHRFYGPIIELKKLIDAGTLGKPLFFRNIFSGWMDLKHDHRARPELSGGGCLIDHCSHSIDLFRYLVGEPTHVQAWAANVAQKVAIEDFGMIQLSVADKAFGEIVASYSLRTAENTIEWHGTKGSALVNYWEEGRPDLAYRLEWGPYTPVDCSAHLSDRYTIAIQHFVACVRGRQCPAVVAADGLKTSRIVRRVYEAACGGRRVAVK